MWASLQRGGAEDPKCLKGQRGESEEVGDREGLLENAERGKPPTAGEGAYL